MAGSDRTAGTLYNIKLASSGVGPDGKKTWTLIGRAFIRADGTGGALFVGEGETERKYALFPQDRRPKATPQAQPQRAPMQRMPAAGGL